MPTTSPQTTRGAGLLLAHCHSVLDERPSAYERLQDLIGGDLARLLVFALAGPQGRRGSSSP
jgi:hypothetical protein